MSELKKALQQKFGEARVTDIESLEDDYIDLIKIDIQTHLSLRVIMTHGMSDYKMPIPEHLDTVKDKVYNEIFFCIPEYWDLEDKDNPNMNWPREVLQKMAKNVIENNTWYGPGHTIANGNPSKPISSTMKQEYFLLTTPIHLEDYLQPLEIGDKTINFLAIIPLFDEEYNQLIYRAYPKWIRRYRSRNHDEILDDFRVSMKNSRWSFRR